MILRFLSKIERYIALFIVVLTGSALAVAAPPRWNPPIPSIDAKNLLPNSSFEMGADGWSSWGKGTISGGDLCGLFGEVQVGNAVDGTHCLRIELGPGLTEVTHSDYGLGPSRAVIQAAPLAANLGWMEVRVDETYVLSAYMRADHDGVPADLVFHFGGDINANYGKDTHSKRVTLTRDWTRYSFSMVAYRPDVFVAMGPNLSAAPDASATVWIDAVQLETSPVGVATDDESTLKPTPYTQREPVEIGIDSGHYGNLFDVTEPIGFTLFGSNSTAADATATVRVDLENYFGDRGPTFSTVLVVSAKGRAMAFLPVKVPGAGYYKVHFSWNVGDIAHTRTIKMAVVDTYPWDDSPFGLNHVPTTVAACMQLKKAGITWARDWSMKWDSVEPTEGVYDFAEIDRQVDRIQDVGMHLLPLLPSQPSASWSSEAPTGELSPVKRRAYAPAAFHRPSLNAFVAASVKRYKDRVRYWEFLNEPLWVPWYCLPTDGGYTVDTYLELLQGASAAMKSTDPSCQVIGGLSIMASSALGDEFIRKGGLDYVDIYNLHPYPERDAPESFIPWMKRILGEMDALGGRKPIWATELSYWATDDKPWRLWMPPNANHWSANRQQTNEREAADYMVRLSVILLAHGVEKIFWHSGLEGVVNNGLMDLENPLLDPEAVPQKAFAAQAALSRLLGPAPKFVAPFQKPETLSDHSTSGIHGYVFDVHDGAAMVVWAPGVLNNGERQSDGMVPLGESPVYLKASAMTAQELSNACRLVPDTKVDANGWSLNVPEALVVQTVVGTPMLGD